MELVPSRRGYDAEMGTGFRRAWPESTKQHSSANDEPKTFRNSRWMARKALSKTCE